MYFITIYKMESLFLWRVGKLYINTLLGMQIARWSIICQSCCHLLHGQIVVPSTVTNKINILNSINILHIPKHMYTVEGRGNFTWTHNIPYDFLFVFVHFIVNIIYTRKIFNWEKFEFLQSFDNKLLTKSSMYTPLNIKCIKSRHRQHNVFFYSNQRF